MQTLQIQGGKTELSRSKSIPKDAEFVLFPKSLKVIKDRVFNDYRSLKEVSFPTGLESIGEMAFANTRLSFVKFPSTLTSFGMEAFARNIFLEEVVFPEDSQLAAIGIGCFSGSKNLKLVQLPPKVETIGKRAFQRCFGLEEIELPKSLTFIDSQAFAHSGLKHLTLHSGIREIGSRAFQSCRDLEHLTVTGTIDKIGDQAFSGCVHLEYAEFLKDPVKIGYHIFNKHTTVRCLKNGVMHRYCETHELNAEFF